MKVFGSELISLYSGEVVMIMLAHDEIDCERLYHYLTIDAYEFKKHLVEHHPEVNYLSVGFRNPNGKLDWNKNYIELPKWYDLN
ncbi:hypothetical protein [Pedobacter agri]|uniref:hypothetical protein n=1 Tax=Pedobacter agri TaxID=454586 RepID=UPI00292DE3B3|nr:hypothetical protein [Pedobacter agri]